MEEEKEASDLKKAVDIKNKENPDNDSPENETEKTLPWNNETDSETSRSDSLREKANNELSLAISRETLFSLNLSMRPEVFLTSILPESRNISTAVRDSESQLKDRNGDKGSNIYSNQIQCSDSEMPSLIFTKDADNNDIILRPSVPLILFDTSSFEFSKIFQQERTTGSEDTRCLSRINLTSPSPPLNGNFHPNTSKSSLCLNLVESGIDIFPDPFTKNLKNKSRMVRMKSEFIGEGLKESSSILLTARVSTNFLKIHQGSLFPEIRDDIASAYILGNEKYGVKPMESTESISSRSSLYFGESYRITPLDKRFRTAWRLSQVYNKTKKETVETNIPLTATSTFTRKISFCTRFCRTLKSTRFFCNCCYPGSRIGLSLTPKESIEEFHNEMYSRNAEERPEMLVRKRRKNLVGSTKSMKVLRKRHESRRSKSPKKILGLK